MRTSGVHSGYAETSMMLVIRPGFVNMSRAEEGRSDAEFYHPDRIKYSQLESLVFGTKYHSRNGVLGDPREANAQAGKELIEKRGEITVEEIRTAMKAQEGR